MRAGELIDGQGDVDRAGEDDNGNIGMEGFHLLGHFDAGGALKQMVGQDQVNVLRGENLQGLVSAGGRNYFVPCTFQHGGAGAKAGRLVIHT